MTAIPHLIADVPGAPRVETRAYGLPRQLSPRVAGLLATPHGELDRDELLEIAADAANRDAIDLAGRQSHISAVCKLACELAQEIDIALRATVDTSNQLAACQGVGAAFERENASLTSQLTAAVRARNEEYNLRIAAQAEALRLADLHHEMSRQLAEMGHVLTQLAYEMQQTQDSDADAVVVDGGGR